MSLSLAPLLPFSVAFILGIVLHGLGIHSYWLFVALAVAVGLIIARRRYPALMVCGIILGYVDGFCHSPQSLPAGFAGHDHSCSCVAVDVNSYEGATVVIASVDSCDCPVGSPMLLKLVIPSSLPEIEERDRLRFSAMIDFLDNTADLPGEIDFNLLLRRKGVVGQAFVHPDSIRVLYPEPGILNSVRRFRTDVTLAITDLPLSSSAREFLNALVTGDRSMLTADMRDLFSSTGLSHILALSGLHVAIIAGIISVLLFPLRLFCFRWLRTALMLLLLWGFAVMTGLTSSVVRSVIMVSVFMISYSMQRSRSTFNSLCVAALLILVVNPSSLHEVGFQLSFLAVGSILVFAEKLNPFSRRQWLLYGLAAYPAVTLAAVLGTAMTAAFYFNVIPLSFLPANFIGALLLPLILSGAVVLIALDFMGVVSTSLCSLVDGMFMLLHASASWLSDLPLTSLNDVCVSGTALITSFMTVIAFALWLYIRRPVHLIASSLCLSVTLLALLYPAVPVEASEVYIPRNRQHTSLMVRDGNVFHIITSAPERMHGELTSDCHRKYHRYFLMRGIDSLHIRSLTSSTLSPVTVGRTSFLLVSDTRQMLAMSSESVDTMPKSNSVINYAVVCNGFRGDVVSLARMVQADSILLSADLNRRRHDRYLAELTCAGYKTRSLKNSPFVMNERRAVPD